MRHYLSNTFRLGVKELRSLFSDKILVFVLCWTFSFGIYVAATGTSVEVHNAPIAIVDLDRSPLSGRIAAAFTAPYFLPPRQIALSEMDSLMDGGEITFSLVFPHNFQRDLAAGKRPEVQLNIDATNMSQAFNGSSYIQNILTREVLQYQARQPYEPPLPIKVSARVRFNPNLTGMWFGGVMEIINNITLLSIALVGAAFIREREHGTLEHLLVMPLRASEIMIAKVWANALVVLVAAAFSLQVMVRLIMSVPIAGSVPLFLSGAVLCLFSTTSIGIFLATLARSMPQFGLLIILVVLPLEMLSGGATPRESMPELAQQIMLAAPTTHFVKLAQTILYRGGGLDVVWPQFLAIATIGAVFFLLALLRFRRSVTETQL